jgi:hypothetical protein
MPITIHKDRKSGERSEELKNFKEEMIIEIKETEIALKIREENKKKEEEDREKQNQEDRVKSQLDKARTRAFEYIEKELNEKNLKIQDLGEHANYQERINNLDKVYKIRDLQEKVLDHIFSLPKPKPDNPLPKPQDNPNPERPKPDEPKEREKVETEKIDNFISGFRNNKYDN